jgi:hypothetical protein
VTRGMWKHFRYANRMPGKRNRKNTRPTTVRVTAPDGKSVVIPYDEYPAPAIFLQMPRAGILEELPADLDRTPEWMPTAFMDETKAKSFEKRFGIPLTFTMKHDPESFGRMLIKIGYCHVLTHIHPNEFDALCLPYILGIRKNVSHLVGRSDTSAPAQGGYWLQTAGAYVGGRLLLLANVSILSALRTPTYQVVVGEIKGDQSVLAFAERHGVRLQEPP